MKKEMKSLLVLAVFGLLFGIFLIGGIRAEIHSCSSSDDIIMKLYSSTNSHGALWDDAIYGYDICYSDIFGTAYTGASPHVCTGTGAIPDNKVLGLYSSSNSHAEIPSLDVYTNDVCYGNLECTDSNNLTAICMDEYNQGNIDDFEFLDCIGDAGNCTDYFTGKNYEIVLSLYDTTNSHISAGDDTNYPVKICCTSEEEVIVTGAYWANMKEETITDADLNDRVKLMVAGQGMESKWINYTIYKSVAFWFDQEKAQTSTIGFTTWRASEAGTYYFIAEVEGINMQSGDLVVSSTENNSPPVANIIGPELGDIFYIGEQINFTQISYDEDDEINFLWDLGDGSTSSEPGLIHSYTDKDQKTIKLTATDERGLVVIDRTSILIINPSGTKYVFAHIDKPKWGESISGMIISFNASSSYAVETTSCDGTSCTINCLGGACHLLTHTGGQNIQDPNGKRGNYDDLNFSWTFDDNVTYRAKGMSGVWFNKVFGTIGNHWAKLITSINPEGSSETEFSNYVKSECSIDLLSGGKWIWWDASGSPLDPLKDPGACLDIDGTLQYPSCCPPGYACQIPSDAPDPTDPMYAICQISGSDYCARIVVCDDYPSQAECEADICGKGILQPTSTCGGTVTVSDICGFQYFTSVENECKCEWNETVGCVHVQGLISTIYQDIQLVHNCKDRIEHGECVDGLMNIKKTSELILDESISISEGEKAMCKEKLCPAYEGTIMCGQPLIKLLFFSLKNLIIAIIIIIIIYVIWIKKRNKGKIEVRKKKKL